MADKKQDAALVAVVVTFFYGDAIPGDTVMVNADEAARLIGLGASPAPAPEPAPKAKG